jgi:hypothetical protein
MTRPQPAAPADHDRHPGLGQRVAGGLAGAAGLLLAAAMVPGLAASASAAAFAPGDVAVYQAGSSASPVTSAGAPLFIDEYTPAGTLVQSLALPTVASGTQKPIVASGTATSEGLLTLSPNGTYLLATGYDAAVGATGLTSSTSSSVPRTVAELTSTGAVDTSTTLTDFATGNNPRSAVTVNGNQIWVAGAAGSVRATTLGLTTSTPITNTTDKNFRGSLVAAPPPRRRRSRPSSRRLPPHSATRPTRPRRLQSATLPPASPPTSSP